MKFIHLSDLHIRKRVHEFSMIEDQKYILNQILEIVRGEQPDGVLIAGDIYDKPVPSAEAVQVFDRFLTSLADLGTAVFAVSGNHDSAERIAFGAELMSSRKVYVSSVYEGTVKKITMEDAYGKLQVHLLPFIKPVVVRHAFAGQEEAEKIDSYERALEMAAEYMDVDRSERNVIVAHQFVTGARRCDSEEVNVGGLDQISADLFEKFDYAALGHIHSPQMIGRETVRYCGTPLKYSFSEATQTKSVTVVNLLEKGNTEVRTIELKPLRDMRKLRGSYMELMQRSSYEGTNTDDYVQITLTDEEDIPGGMQKLRSVYPNLMHLEYDNIRTRTSRQITAAEGKQQKSELELFGEFYEAQNNQMMSKEQELFVRELIERMIDQK
ncbi:MAG: exonuclease SbcCD subunit D [Lachnospiraceae bacterium]